MIKQQVEVDGVLTLVPQDKLTRRVIGQDNFDNNIYGDYYKYYKLVDGVYVPDMEKINAEITKQETEAIKTAKDKQLEALVVEANTVPFDGDIQSIGYMSSVLALANFKMIQAVASGVTIPDGYDSIYKTVIQWKNANDTISDVQLETVAEALEKAMLEIAIIKTT